MDAEDNEVNVNTQAIAEAMSEDIVEDILGEFWLRERLNAHAHAAEIALLHEEIAKRDRTIEMLQGSRRKAPVIELRRVK